MHLRETLKLCTQSSQSHVFAFDRERGAAVCPVDVVRYREDAAIVLRFALGIELLPKHGYFRVAHVVDGLLGNRVAAKNDVAVPVPATRRGRPFITNQSGKCAGFIGFVGGALSTLPLVGHGVTAGKVLVVTDRGRCRISRADDG